VKTVYNWVASTAQSTGVNVNEIGRLKRENELLKSIIGKFVYEEELKKKRGFNLSLLAPCNTEVEHKTAHFGP